MKRIYWDKGSIGIVTDLIDSSSHSHPALQLFLSIEGDLDIEILDESFSCQCVVVNKNIRHAFNTKRRIHFSLIIVPGTILADQLCQRMKDSNHLIYDSEEIKDIQKQAKLLLSNHSIEGYQKFKQELFQFLGVEENSRMYDGRVLELLSHLDECSCDEHSIEKFASKVSLSSSRLSHLFKEQTGVTIKSFIMLHQMEQAFMGMLGGESVSESALNAGFDSPSHFAATTKRLIGMSASFSIKDSEFLKVFDL